MPLTFLSKSRILNRVEMGVYLSESPKDVF